MSNPALSASAKGATYFILVQIGSRALTFALNQTLLRYLSPEVLGISVQLELYSITVLYFARESLRVALQRQPASEPVAGAEKIGKESKNGFIDADSAAGKTQTVVNLAYISFVLGVPLTVLLGKLYLRSSSLPTSTPYFAEALALYGLAALLELLSEPGFAVVQQKLLYGIRASAESLATVSKCLVTFGATIWAARAGKGWGVLPFALGQLAYASVLLVVYVARLWPVSSREGFSLLPRRLTSTDPSTYIRSLLSRPLCSLGLNLTFQSSLKYILTQGDALLITTLATLPEQGAYALASNYGGLIARMLFQPIEESSRNLFAKLCAEQPRAHASFTAATAKEAAHEPKDSLGSEDENPPAATSNTHHATQTLHLLLHTYTLLSLPILLFLPPASTPLLTLLAGPTWSSSHTSPAPRTLANYALYIPLLALNGITESFVSATASPHHLRLQSLWMSLFFLLFAASAWLFVRGVQGGAAGLVWANCVNLGLRTGWSVWFIATWFRGRGVQLGWRWWKAVLPKTETVAGAVAMWAILRSGVVSAGGDDGEGDRWAAVVQLLRIGVVGLGFVAALLVTERAFFMHCYRLLRHGATP